MPLLTVKPPNRPMWQHAVPLRECDPPPPAEWGVPAYVPPKTLAEMLGHVRASYREWVSRGVESSSEDHSLAKCLVDLDSPATVFEFDPDYEAPRSPELFPPPDPNWKQGDPLSVGFGPPSEARA